MWPLMGGAACGAEEEFQTTEGVLAECAAKRKIVEECGPGVDEVCQSYAGNYVYAPCPTLRAVAVPYADHPDYQQEWA